MSRKRKGILLIILALSCWIGGGTGIALGVVSLVKSLKAEAKIDAPGTVTITVESPERYTIWYEFSGFTANGVSFSHPEKLPNGYSFEVAGPNGNYPTTIYSGGSMTSGSTERKSVIKFKADVAGAYTVTIKGPQNEPRTFAILKGGVMAGFGQLFIGGGVAALTGVIGVVFLIVGLVCLLNNTRTNR